MHYRLAVPEDAPAFLQIYSEYIHSTITFEYTLPTTEEFAERIRTIAGFYPVHCRRRGWALHGLCLCPPSYGTSGVSMER